MNNFKILCFIALDVLKRRLLNQSTPVRETWEQTPEKFDDLTEFMNWFDKTSSLEDTRAAAQRDWKFRFQNTTAFADIGKGRSLEIGFGGGRLLAQAAREFNEAIGVDIHKAFANTRRYLEYEEVSNFHLLHRDSLKDLEDGCIDFVYSFIVFQHFDSKKEIEFYLEHIKRLLNKNGVAHIYYGKTETGDVIEASDRDFALRDCSLFINPSNMRHLIGQHFDILDYEDNLPKNPETGEGSSGQARIVFGKKSAAS